MGSGYKGVARVVALLAAMAFSASVPVQAQEAWLVTVAPTAASGGAVQCRLRSGGRQPFVEFTRFGTGERDLVFIGVTAEAFSAVPERGYGRLRFPSGDVISLGYRTTSSGLAFPHMSKRGFQEHLERLRTPGTLEIEIEGQTLRFAVGDMTSQLASFRQCESQWP